MKQSSTISIRLAAGFLVLTIGFGQPCPAQNSPIEKISESVYRIGTVLVESEKREIYLDGKVNLQAGPIELLACTSWGKVHESVLVLNIVPHDFQVALLLLGLDEKKVEYSEELGRVIGGDSMAIYVKWSAGQDSVEVRGEKLVFNLVTGREMDATRWIFVGSRIEEGVFRADSEGSLITTYSDPYTIVDSAAELASDDEAYVVNQTLVPPVNTPVKVTIRVLNQAGPQEESQKED